MEALAQLVALVLVMLAIVCRKGYAKRKHNNGRGYSKPSAFFVSTNVTNVSNVIMVQ